MMKNMGMYQGSMLISTVLVVIISSVLISGCVGIGSDSGEAQAALAATLPAGGGPEPEATSTAKPTVTEVPATPTRIRATATQVPPTATATGTATVPSETEEARGVVDATIGVPEEAADSVESDGTPTQFGAEHLVDGDPRTAWRMAGDGMEAVITLDFTAPLTVTGLEIIPGYAKTDPHDGTDRFVQNRRIGMIRIDVDGQVVFDARLEDSRELQRIDLPEPGQGDQVILTILETTDHGGRDFTAISELAVLTDAGT
jgi:hypothetical protein